jgi:hypothetical protein
MVHLGFNVGLRQKTWDLRYCPKMMENTMENKALIPCFLFSHSFWLYAVKGATCGFFWAFSPVFTAFST